MYPSRVGWTHCLSPNRRKVSAGVWPLSCMCDDMPAARRFGWNLFACLALATIACAQTSSPTQPWAATAHWSASVMPGTLGPLAVDSTGDLLVANNLVGFKSPTKTLGDTSQHFSWVSKVN